MTTGGDVIFVGDGLLFGVVTVVVILCDMRVVGAFNSDLTPSVVRLDIVLPGEDDDGVTALPCGGNVFSLIGTKALRTSSGEESLPLSLGLRGGVRDGLFGIAGPLMLGVPVLFGNPGYSEGYFT